MNTQARTYRTPWFKVSYLWFLLLQGMATVGAWAAASGGQILRGFALGSVMLSILLPLLISLEAGLMAMVIFEPFRGLLRRMQYLIVPYSNMEPIHLLTPIGALFALMMVLNRHRLHVFIATPVAKAVTVLSLICFVQMFNPLQGGIFVGLSGGMFVLVPMVWFYFGQHADANLFPRVLKAIVLLGTVASLYGVYQMLAGYPAFEQYWIDNTDGYESIAVYGVTRAIATFSNAEEWGRYVQLGCLIAFGLAASRSEGRLRPFWFAAAIILAVMITLTGQRSAIFGLFLGLIVLFITGARTWGSAFVRVAALGIALVGFLLGSSYLVPDEGDLKKSEGVSTIVSHTTKGTFDPANEYSFGVRLETWTNVIARDIPRNPIGAGLGESTVAGTRNSDRDRPPIDNYFFSLALSAGVPAVLLLIWIFWRSLRAGMKLCRSAERHSGDFAYARIGLALLASLILNNFFGTSFVMYSIAPIGWLLIGWLSARNTEVG